MTVARFWRKIPQRYNLIGTKCETCQTVFFPPRTLCPDCRRDGKIVDHHCGGKGTVVTFTVVRTASDQFSNLTPYVLAIIELDEGCRLTSQVICEPSEIFIGMKVKSVFRVITEDGPSGIIHYGTKFVPV
ncbi:MAG: Zn-ribbon domain-containing OB-fold protein [Methanocalculus sp.]|uniref:Zn-ribbon domain-containing OB-fold protein n=1 Tax=Methanocalculus sp. TaxID=2004547 RepID=UPI00271D4153|nr:Zn-ribbon domain-containing OB-fold protein [Methanocalculus sp.]MDO9539093.1 Zn-ribbon domain-containing OB-fold protein [Methanocalculus sp.]